VDDTAEPFDYSTHEKQLILAKQLIERGTNVNDVSSPHGMTLLHDACISGSVTNLEFVEFTGEKIGKGPHLRSSCISPALVRHHYQHPLTLFYFLLLLVALYRDE
jgi:hypothetical protein